MKEIIKLLDRAAIPFAPVTVLLAQHQTPAPHAIQAITLMQPKPAVPHALLLAKLAHLPQLAKPATKGTT